MNIQKNQIRHALSAAMLLVGFSGVSWADVDDLAGTWNFTIGGGYSAPVGGLNSVLTDGWNFTVGTQYNVSEKTGVAFEFMNHHLGIERGVLDHYSNLLGGASTDGTANVWSLSLSPTWRFNITENLGAYIIGGGGYYHVRAEITTPGVGYVPGYCDYYWGCWPGGFVGIDNSVAEHKDDTGGVNAGFGFNYILGSTGVRFFIETRYHYIMTNGPDLTLMPFTAGFRF